MLHGNFAFPHLFIYYFIVYIYMDLRKVFYVLENYDLFYTALLKQLEFLAQEAVDIDFGVPPGSSGPLCWRIIFRNQDPGR